MICVVCNTSTDREYAGYAACSEACDAAIQFELDADLAHYNHPVSDLGLKITEHCWVCDGPMSLEEVNKTGDHLTCSLECRRKLDEESC